MKNGTRLASHAFVAFALCSTLYACAPKDSAEAPVAEAPAEAAPEVTADTTVLAEPDVATETTVLAEPQEATEAPVAEAPAENLESNVYNESYAVGANVGRSIAEPGIALDLDAFIAGFKAAHAQEELAMTPEEIQTAMMALQQKAQAAAEQKQAEVSKEMEALGASAKAEGDTFLAENAKKEGIQITESGLQYKVLTEGDGPLPAATDQVKVHYTGTFINGEKFDSSVDRGEPATFGVDQVIPGWTEALKLMKVGSKWQLAIPSDLAYGPQGRGTEMPPNSVLLFDVELIEIVK